MHNHNHFHSTQERNARLERITLIVIFVNVLLAALKIIAGVLGNSNSLISDSIHTVSDIVLSVIVIIGLYFSKKSNKFEDISAIIVAVLLILISAELIIDSSKVIYNFFSNSNYEFDKPTWLPIIVSIIAIITKEVLFYFSIKIGKKENSKSVIANAWHQRLDSLASLVSLISMIFALIFIHFNFTFAVLFDPIGVIIITILIIREVIHIFKDSIKDILK